MSSKKKSAKHWVLCSRCACYYINMDKEFHESTCFSIQIQTQFQVISSNVSPKRFEIHNKSISTFINKIKPLDTDKYKNETSSSLNYKVFLNPKSMTEFSISISQLVVLDNVLVVEAWPDSNLAFGDVAITKFTANTCLKKESLDFVNIKTLENFHGTAELVYLEFSEGSSNWFEDERALLSYVKYELKNCYLSKEQLISVNVLSQTYILKINSITTSKYLKTSEMKTIDFSPRENDKIINKENNSKSNINETKELIYITDKSFNNINNNNTINDTNICFNNNVNENIDNHYNNDIPNRTNNYYNNVDTLDSNKIYNTSINELCSKINLAENNLNKKYVDFSKVNNENDCLTHLRLHNDFDTRWLKITDETKFRFIKFDERINFSVTNSKNKNKTNFGGYENEKKILLGFLESNLHEQPFKQCQSCLIYGSSGSGKSLLFDWLKENCNQPIKFVSVRSHDILLRYDNENDQSIIAYFQQILNIKSKLAILIDDLDALILGINSSKDNDNSMYPTIIRVIDLILNSANCQLLIVTAFHPTSLLSDLLESSRLKHRIYLGPPTNECRFEILQSILSVMNCNFQGDLKQLADKCHAFLALDLEHLCHHAQIKALKRLHSKINVHSMKEKSFDDVKTIDISENQTKVNLKSEINFQNNDLSHIDILCKRKKKKINNSDDLELNKNKLYEQEIEDKLLIKIEDVEYGYNMVKNGRLILMNRDAMQVEKVRWNDVCGQSELKQRIKQLVVWPIKLRKTLYQLGFQQQKGLLLFGPPGCSKTMLAKAVATECELNFFAVKGSELMSKYVGESEKNIRDLFSRAQFAAPSIIFFDEIDSISQKRSNETSGNSGSLLTTILTELDGIKSLCGVSVLGATNMPWRVDQALLRPGRLAKSIYVKLPDRQVRTEIITNQFKIIKCISPLINIDQLALSTEGYSGAEVFKICQLATQCSLLENPENPLIEWKHFESVLKEEIPTTCLHMLQMYEQFNQNQEIK